MKSTNSFEKLACEMYALLDVYNSKALQACSTVNPRHPIPRDHIKLISFIESIQQVKYDKPGLKLKLFFIFKSIVYACRETIYLIWLKIFFFRKIKLLKEQSFDVLIKTWFFEAPQNEGDDFYFGALPALLRDRHKRVLIIGGNLGKTSQISFASALFSSGRVGIPEKALIPIWAPLVTVVQQCLTSFKLSVIANQKINNVFNAVTNEASLQCLSVSTQINMLHYYIGKNSVSIWEPSTYLTPYEGQPWEKLAWKGAKTASPKCIISGYQHTIIMPYSLALIKPYKNIKYQIYSPEVILTIGNIPREIMRKKRNSELLTFVTMGSFRRTDKQVDTINIVPKPKLKTILVTPEGLLPEAVILFQRALELAILLPDYLFILRSHPVLPIEQVIHFLTKDLKEIPNITLSIHTKLEDDLAKSSILFYRGSSVVLYAILNGIKPYYLDEPLISFVDPLYDMKIWRESNTSVSEIAKNIKIFENKDINDLFLEWEPARAYVNDYVVIAKPHAVDTYLNMID